MRSCCLVCLLILSGAFLIHVGFLYWSGFLEIFAFSSPALTLCPSYLVQIMLYGPNNQYLAFLNMLALADVVNATFVLPSFYEHHFDKGPDRRLRTFLFNDTFDVTHLPSAPLTVSTAEFQRCCGGTLDIVVDFRSKCGNNTRRLDLERLELLRSVLQNHRCVGARLLAEVPLKFYFPFARYLHRAPAVRHSAQQFLRTVGVPILACHIRRLEAPLRLSGCRNESLAFHCGNRLDEELTEIKKYMRKYSLDKVYVATTELDTISELRRRLGAALLSSADVHFERTENYIISLVEQEICLLASAFLGSPSSTWSHTVMMQRMTQKPEYPASYFDGRDIWEAFKEERMSGR